MKRIINFSLFVFLVLIVFTSCKSEKNGVLFEDNFSNASSLKSNWIITDCKEMSSGPSEWIIEENQLFQKSNIYRAENEYDYYEGTRITTKKGKNWTDYDFSVDFSIAGDDDGIGVVFRYKDNEHFYRFITVEDASNKGPFRKLQLKDGDKYITLAESNDGYNSAESHKIRVNVVGNKIKIYFDDVEIFSVKDSHYKKGGIGLMSYAEQPIFDNVLVKTVE